MPAIFLVLAFIGGLFAHREWRKWRTRICDACRLDDMNESDQAVWIAHTCSRARGFYREKSGEILQFGRRKGEQVR